MKHDKYPPVPDPVLAVDKNGDGIPNASNIYFIWKNGLIVYVGQSINLGTRVKIGHHAIQEGDTVSWVEIQRDRLNFAEAFYIGMLCPMRNFGQRGYARLQTDLIKKAEFSSKIFRISENFLNHDNEVNISD